MLAKLLFLPLTAPIAGVTFVAEKIAEQVDREFFDKASITRRLVELETRRDLGQISDDEYQEREQELLAALDAAEAPEIIDEDEEEED